MLSGRIRPKLVLPERLGPATRRLDDKSFGPNSHQASGFLKNAYYNGLGRYVSQLARITIKFSHTSPTSHGTREFVQDKLIDFCRQNPGTAVYLKPRFKPTPVLTAEYLDGSWHWMSLQTMKPNQVYDWLMYHVERSGEPIKRIRKPHSTAWPSIQGVWTPFTNLPAENNAVEWPSRERGEVKPTIVSGTQHVLNLKDSI